MKLSSIKNKLLLYLPSYRLKLHIDALNRRIDKLTEALENLNHKNDYLFWQIMRKEGEPYEDAQKRIMFSLPQAIGDLRFIQLGNNYILKRIRSISELHNIHILLGFGTLLGAIRHHGFIPWDDDIDILVMREEFDKLVSAIRSDKELKIATYFYYSDVPRHVIKIKLKESETFWVDVWICDKIGIFNSINETWDKTLIMTESFITELEKQFKQRYSSYADSFIDLSLEKYMNEFGRRITEKNEWYNHNSEAVCLGFEYSYWFRKIMRVTELEKAFPLVSGILFEGEEYESFREPEEWLKREYGDYLSFPRVIKPEHQWEIGNLSEKDRDTLNKLGIH